MKQFLKKVKQILDGYSNLLLDDNKEIAYVRSLVCADCKLNKDGWCDNETEDIAVKDFNYGNEPRFKGKPYKGCSCNLKAKVRCTKDCFCPLGKW